ncbi:MAG: prepilin peptidase [Alphaproteobacteria bacterium]
MFESLPFALFPALMTFAGAFDFLTLSIPNRVSLAIAFAFFPVAILAGLPLEAMALHLSCALVTLAFGFALFAGGWFGGGDAKLFAAAALWIGWEQILAYGVAVAIIGGALAIVYVMLRMLPARYTAPPGRWAASIRQLELPYGVALAGAALAISPHVAWMTTAIA